MFQQFTRMIHPSGTASVLLPKVHLVKVAALPPPCTHTPDPSFTQQSTNLALLATDTINAVPLLEQERVKQVALSLVSFITKRADPEAKEQSVNLHSASLPVIAKRRPKLNVVGLGVGNDKLTICKGFQAIGIGACKLESRECSRDMAVPNLKFSAVHVLLCEPAPDGDCVVREALFVHLIWSLLIDVLHDWRSTEARS